MRKAFLLLIPLALAPLAGLALPAAAESEGGSCASTTVGGPVDLGAIQTKSDGTLAITGVRAGDNECDDMVVGAAGAKGISGVDDGGALSGHEGNEGAEIE